MLSISLAGEGGSGEMEKEEHFSYDFDSVVRGRIFWRGVRGKSGAEKKGRWGREEHLLSWNNHGENPDGLFLLAFLRASFLPSFFVLVILFARIAKMRVTHAPFLPPSQG